MKRATLPVVALLVGCATTSPPPPSPAQGPYAISVCVLEHDTDSLADVVAACPGVSENDALQILSAHEESLAKRLEEAGCVSAKRCPR